MANTTDLQTFLELRSSNLLQILPRVTSLSLWCCSRHLSPAAPLPWGYSTSFPGKRD